MSEKRTSHRRLGPPHAPPGLGVAENLGALVHAAQRGDPTAWTRIVRRFESLLRGIARTYRLSESDVDDVVQTTWALLVRHVGDIREPLALPGWLATTVHRQSLRKVQSGVREVLTDEPYHDYQAGDDAPEDALLAAERRAVLGRALGTLPDRQRRLMTVLVAQSGRDYEHASAILDMPLGSIGPTRARSLERLRRHPELRRLHLGNAA